ncbi:MAG: DUF1800 domain-containing protein [Fimbriimonadaceae bacterium]
MERRDFIVAGAAVAAGVVATGCVGLARKVASRPLPVDPQTPELPSFEITALNRMGFGPVPGDLAMLRKKGISAYVEEQLAAPVLENDPVLMFQLSRLDVNRINAAELHDLPEGEVIRQFRQDTLLRQLYSPYQLRERMVDFWTNHFNIIAEKGENAYRKPTDDREVIRKNALGNFHDLLVASAHSAAMLGYLNNDLNKKGVANENYAREIMELHTLGVHGGYSQKDVMELARCLTGWHIETRMLRPKQKFRYDEKQHDDVPATVLGHRLAGGKPAGDQALRILANHPSTARFITGKLCRYFLGDYDHLAHDGATQTFLKTKGDIKAVLRAILTEENLKNAKPLVKRPNDFLLSALRAIGAESDCATNLHNHLTSMGQPLYGWPMPDGYPDRTAAWTGSLMARWNFCWQLENKGIGGTWFREDYVKGRESELILGIQAPGKSIAVCMAAPAFQWR